MSTPMDKQLLDLQKKIYEDSKVTAAEFSQLTSKMNEVTAGRAKTDQELTLIRQTMEKAMADAKENAAEKTRIMEEYKAQVPAAVFKDTIKEVTDKQQTMTKWVILAILASMLLFFGQDLMATLGPWLASLLP
jgi:SpoVK/Ycf46/Vps4 family AAA+-type ATPase